jgi:hypothetical protein
VVEEDLGRLLFVGAGASIPLGLPRMDALIAPVALRALEAWGNERSKSADRLAEYLALVHGLGKHDLERAAKGDVGACPGIVDLLTVLDLTLAENGSFGHWPKRRRNRSQRREFSGDELRAVHRTMVGAIGDFVSQPPRMAGTSEAARSYAALARAFETDCIITTNWDSLLDRALWRVSDPARKWKPGAERVRYSPIGETVVEYDGKRLPLAPGGTPLLKLHGSLNWLCCPRCDRLIVNAAADLRPDEDGSRELWDYDCWCEAEADPLIVTPSFFKNYGNIHTRAIWREAQRALAFAREWTFVGYSLPLDDFAVRALITRALAWKRSEGRAVVRVRVYDYLPTELRELGDAKVKADSPDRTQLPKPVQDYLALADRYRGLVGASAHPLEFHSGGMIEAAAALGARP